MSDRITKGNPFLPEHPPSAAWIFLAELNPFGAISILSGIVSVIIADGPGIFVVTTVRALCYLGLGLAILGVATSAARHSVANQIIALAGVLLNGYMAFLCHAWATELARNLSPIR